MLDNKHEVILHKNDRFVGTGHNSTLLEDDEKNTWMLYHAFELERLDAQRQVLLDRILWDEEMDCFIVFALPLFLHELFGF